MTEPTALLREQTAPLSSIVKAAGLLWFSGLTLRDISTGHRETGGIEEQASVVMENMCLLLERAERSFPDVVRNTIYLTDPADFDGINVVYRRYFSHPYPARSMVVVAGLVHPKYRIEIDVVATAADP